MTRSHTAKSNNNGLSDKRYDTSRMNNNSVVASSPSKVELKLNTKKPCNEKIVEDSKANEEQCSSNIKSNSPTKKSVTSSMMSFTSSLLAAAAASAKTEALLDSQEQSPTKDRHNAIDISPKHQSPLKRASTPSASPTRRGGRGTKTSSHQGTPPQSPPTPHKIICQATIETIEPPMQSSSSEEGLNDEKQKQNSSIRGWASPNQKKLSPGLKLISAISPKKSSSSLDTEHSIPLKAEKSPNQAKHETNELQKRISNIDEDLSRPARRNLTSSLMNNSIFRQSDENNRILSKQPKKR